MLSYRGEVPGRGGSPVSAGSWSNVELPAGTEVRFLRLAADGAPILLDAADPRGSRLLVLGGHGGWESLVLPPHLGLLTSLTLHPDGSIYLGGERGEIFRYHNGTWEEQRAPVSGHPKQILAAATGELWARAQSRGQSVFLHHDGQHWRAHERIGDMSTLILWAGPDQALLRIGTAVYRCHRQLPCRRELVLETGSIIVAAEHPDRIWAIRNGRLERYEQGQWHDEGETPPAVELLDIVGNHVVAYSESGTWLRTDGSAPEAFTAPLGMQPVEQPHFPRGVPMYGLAVLRIRERPHLYLTRYSQPDVILPLRPQDQPERWAERSLELGLDAQDESYEWAESYALAAVAADLDGDRDEDVVVATMYDGLRLWKNWGDRRLLPWTQPAGLAGHGDDISVDVDLFDADSDGDLDLYVTALQAPDRLYLNDGVGQFREAMASSGMLTQESSVAALCVDLDADGDTDVAVSSLGRGLQLHENLGPVDGQPRFRTRVLLAELEHPDVPTGLSTDEHSSLAAADLDGDGLPELLVGGRTVPARLLANRGQMEFVEDPSRFAPAPPPARRSGFHFLDADGDGDLDLATTGEGGLRWYRNEGGALHELPANRSAGPDQYSTGAVAVDADGDGDLDLFELFRDGAPRLHRNDNARGGLRLRLEGPLPNPGAVGATVAVHDAATGERVVAPQQVSGGSGYGSHRSKELHFHGLDPSRRYRVVATLPGGWEWQLDDVHAEGAVVVAAPTPLHERATHLLHREWRLRPHRGWWQLTLLATLFVALATIIRLRRSPLQWPWAAVAVVPLVALALRATLFPALRGPDEILLSTAGGAVAGFAVLAITRRRLLPPSLDLLSELSWSLRSFAHNQAPRRVVDRVRLLVQNLDQVDRDDRRVQELLQGDLELFSRVVLPELRAILSAIATAGLDPSPGEKGYAKVERRARQLQAAGASGLLSPRGRDALRELVAALDELLSWQRDVRQQVDERLACRLDATARSFFDERGQLHRFQYQTDLPAVRVVLPPVELRRVLDCLLENSLRARPDGLVVRVEAAVQPTGRVLVHFGDNGPGVPAELGSRIFEPAVSTFEGGTGYGLYAARRALERHGGNLSLGDSSAGALFTIELECLGEMK